MTPEYLPYPVTRRRLSDVTLEVAEAGPPGGPLVILLHGFPDLWQGWHQQMSMLAEAGFRVLAPNQRGYGGSDKPKAIGAYDLDRLARDIIELADSERATVFNLVGHDWGGIVAWWVAAQYPSRISRLVIINAPHPGIFREYVRRRPTQLLRSWYIALFQVPLLPEWLLGVGNHALLFRTLQATSRPGIFDESDRKYLQQGWNQPGSLTAMLNYYRALIRRPPDSLKAIITVPSLILFGRGDPTEESGMATASCELCAESQVILFEHSRHWPQREEPVRTNQQLLEVFKSPSAAAHSG